MVSVIDRYNINIYLSNIYGKKILHLNRKKLVQNKPIFYDLKGLVNVNEKGNFIDLKI